MLFDHQAELASIERFAESKHSTFSQYRLSQLGARKGRTREQTYAELQQQLEVLRRERDELQCEQAQYTRRS